MSSCGLRRRSLSVMRAVTVMFTEADRAVAVVVYNNVSRSIGRQVACAGTLLHWRVRKNPPEVVNNVREAM